MSQNKSKSAPQNAETEPTMASGGGSAWPFVLLGVVLFGCFLHVENSGGAFRADVYQVGTKVPPPMPNEPEEVKLYKAGAQLYAACAGCHQPSGLGSDALNFPPLAGSEFVLREKPDWIIRIILDAVEGPITVRGKTYDNAAMTPFRGALNENQIAAIATFVRGNKDWGNNASHVTPAQVKAIMDATAKNAGTKWRATTLNGVP
ncbi:MAG: c-type cytochrome [Limisphaerales bacterium]